MESRLTVTQLIWAPRSRKYSVAVVPTGSFCRTSSSFRDLPSAERRAGVQGERPGLLPCQPRDSCTHWGPGAGTGGRGTTADLQGGRRGHSLPTAHPPPILGKACVLPARPAAGTAEQGFVLPKAQQGCSCDGNHSQGSRPPRQLCAASEGARTRLGPLPKGVKESRGSMAAVDSRVLVKRFLISAMVA